MPAVKRRATKPTAPRLFDPVAVNINAKVKACQESGVELTEGERQFLSDFRFYRKPTPKQYRLFWSICTKCGVK